MVVIDPELFTYQFTLPLGYVDEGGERHQTGVMRPLTGADEYWLETQAAWGQGGGMLGRLARGLVRLGGLTTLTATHVEQFWLADFRYLQSLYQKLNPPEVHFAGEWRATPWRSCIGR